MRNNNEDEFKDPDFLENLHKYEEMMAGGPAVYLDADELTDIAEYYLIEKEDNERALACIDYALSLHPQATAPLIFQARQHLLDDDLETTQALCDAIPDQTHREVIFLNAELMVRRGQTREAIDYLMDKGKEQTEDYDYYLLDAAYIFMDYEAYEAASELADRLNSYAPDWYKTWMLTADVQLGLCNFGKALSCLNKMLDNDPFSTETWNWAAEAYTGIEKYEKAIEATDYALAIDPSNYRSLQLKGHANLHMEAYEKALSIYEEMLNIDPNDENTLAFMTYCYLCLGEVEKARQTIEEAERLSGGISPDQQVIYEQHANVLAALDRYDEAIHYIDLAEELGGDSPNNYDSIRDDFIRRRDNH